LRDTFLGFGAGIRAKYYEAIKTGQLKAQWYEALTENYMGLPHRSHGPAVTHLESIRQDYPIVFHGVSLSIGSAEPLDQRYLQRLKALKERFEPAWISDHFCWSRLQGHSSHDLLPLPFNEEAVDLVVEHIDQVQEALGEPLVLENISSYVEFNESTMPEWVFIQKVVKRTGCRVLLDLNNVYVNSWNHGFEPLDFLNGLPKDSVQQFHMAGHESQGDLKIDTHSRPVCHEVYELYRAALNRFGLKSTLLEWDDDLPPVATINETLARLHAIACSEGLL
jgi:hypothetical protein